MTITETLEIALKTAGIPGAVAMVGDSGGVRSVAAVGHAVDTVFQLASMTKAVVSVAAMQLVESARLSLDAPLGALLPDLADIQVIAGFGEDGAVQLRPAVRPVTLRHLLTHTSGFGYDFVHAKQALARGPGGAPAFGTMASLRVPLMFDPGDDWAYGISTDWVGLAVEAASGQRLDAYIADHICTPLGMVDSGFVPPLERLAPMMARGPDGALVPYPMVIGGGAKVEVNSGGGGMVGTAADYMKFLRMLLNKGTLDGVQILRPETVAEMARNQIGTLRAGQMESTMPSFSRPIDWFPSMTPGWGLGFLINPEPGPDGRSAGSLAWAGVANTYFWIDPARDLAAVLLMQFLPFADDGALGVLSALERTVYGR